MHRYIINYTLLILWLFVIFFLSSEGHDASSGRSDAVVEVVRTLGATGATDVLTFLVRKSAHITAYFILGLLTVNVLRLYKLRIRSMVIIASVFVLLYAISDEFHQQFVPGRSSEARDVMIDTTAGVVGVGLYTLVEARLRTRRLDNDTK